MQKQAPSVGRIFVMVLFELLNAPVSEEVCAQQPTPFFRNGEARQGAKAARGGFDN